MRLPFSPFEGKYSEKLEKERFENTIRMMMMTYLSCPFILSENPSYWSYAVPATRKHNGTRISITVEVKNIPRIKK